jgi:hypothetical protein
VTEASAIKPLMPASEVLSAFARRGAKAELRVTDRRSDEPNEWCIERVMD